MSLDAAGGWRPEAGGPITPGPARWLLLGILALGLPSAGCARLTQALFAPQQAAANTASTVADSSGASASADSFGGAVDRLLAGQPSNAAELERIKAEVVRRATAERNAAGSAQADPMRLAPWHPRLATYLWPPQDRLVLARTPATAERGMWLYATPLPDAIPPGDPPIDMDISPVRIYPAGQVPSHLPQKLPR